MENGTLQNTLPTMAHRTAFCIITPSKISPLSVRWARASQYMGDKTYEPSQMIIRNILVACPIPLWMLLNMSGLSDK